MPISSEFKQQVKAAVNARIRKPVVNRIKDDDYDALFNKVEGRLEGQTEGKEEQIQSDSSSLGSERWLRAAKFLFVEYFVKLSRVKPKPECKLQPEPNSQRYYSIINSLAALFNKSTVPGQEATGKVLSSSTVSAQATAAMLEEIDDFINELELFKQFWLGMQPSQDSQDSDNSLFHIPEARIWFDKLAYIDGTRVVFKDPRGWPSVVAEAADYVIWQLVQSSVRNTLLNGDISNEINSYKYGLYWEQMFSIYKERNKLNSAEKNEMLSEEGADVGLASECLDSGESQKLKFDLTKDVLMPPCSDPPVKMMMRFLDDLLNWNKVMLRALFEYSESAYYSVVLLKVLATVLWSSNADCKEEFMKELCSNPAMNTKLQQLFMELLRSSLHVDLGDLSFDSASKDKTDRYASWRRVQEKLDLWRLGEIRKLVPEDKLRSLALSSSVLGRQSPTPTQQERHKLYWAARVDGKEALRAIWNLHWFKDKSEGQSNGKAAGLGPELACDTDPEARAHRPEARAHGPYSEVQASFHG